MASQEMADKLHKFKGLVYAYAQLPLGSKKAQSRADEVLALEEEILNDIGKLEELLHTVPEVVQEILKRIQ